MVGFIASTNCIMTELVDYNALDHLGKVGRAEETMEEARLDLKKKLALFKKKDSGDQDFF